MNYGGLREGTFFIGGGGPGHLRGGSLVSFLQNGEGHSFFGKEKNYTMSLLLIYKQSYQSKLI